MRFPFGFRIDHGQFQVIGRAQHIVGQDIAADRKHLWITWNKLRNISSLPENSTRTSTAAHLKYLEQYVHYEHNNCAGTLNDV